VLHPRDADKILEILSDELWAIVGDDRGPRPWEGLLRALEDGLDVDFAHLLADLPMNDEAAVAVQHGAEVVEDAADVEVGNVLRTGSYASLYGVFLAGRSLAPFGWAAGPILAMRPALSSTR
jgi:hypothetical protein